MGSGRRMRSTDDEAERQSDWAGPVGLLSLSTIHTSWTPSSTITPTTSLNSVSGCTTTGFVLFSLHTRQRHWHAGKRRHADMSYHRQAGARTDRVSHRKRPKEDWPQRGAQHPSDRLHTSRHPYSTHLNLSRKSSRVMSSTVAPDSTSPACSPVC
jgi:hypothetical protein